MTPSYRHWRERQQLAVELYRSGLSVPEVAARLGVGRTTVWRYLRLAGTPHLTMARRVPNVWPERRAPYWRLHTRLGAYEVVAGRKFCSRCGRWRLLLDFPHETHKRGVPHQHCTACQRQTRRFYSRHLTPEALENQRERQRFYYEGMRRRNGVPETTAHRRRVTDRAERILLPIEPLVRELLKVEDREELARRAGVDSRSIQRLMSGRSARVRIDLADKLAVALGIPSATIWGEAW